MQVVRSLGKRCCFFCSVQSQHKPRFSYDWGSSVQRLGNTVLEASICTCSDVLGISVFIILA